MALGGNTSVSGDGSWYHLGANYLVDGHGFGDPYGLLFGTTLPGADHPPAWTVTLSLPSLLGLRSFTQHRVFASLIGTATILLRHSRADVWAARESASSLL